jgi:hypothetical protein
MIDTTLPGEGEVGTAETCGAKHVTYIWMAEQTEPGLHGKRYAATTNNTAPEPIGSVLAGERLVYGESMYSEWELIGPAKGDFYENDHGTFVELETPAWRGAPIAIEDVVRLNWYSPIK